MPQLDFAFYPSQLFWLAITFVSLYFVLAYIALPRLKKIQTQRTEAIQGKRQQAEQAAARAETALQNYEEKLAAHKAQAQAESQKWRRQTDDKLQKQRDTAKAAIDQKIQQAETEIASFVSSSQAEIHQAAVIATQEIVRHLAGQEISAEEAAQTISDARQ